MIVSLPVFVRTNARIHGILLSQVEREALASRVRTGDRQSREKMICAFLRYCEKLAYRYSEMFAHVAYEDIFQEAIRVVMETMEQAIAKYDDPFPYIFLSVRREIIRYCLFDSHLIRIPETLENGKAKYEPYQCEELDPFTETLEALEDEQDTHMHHHLYEAIERLQGRYRQVIEMRFGLNGNPTTPLETISMTISGGKTKSMAGSYQKLALQKLRKTIEGNGL